MLKIVGDINLTDGFFDTGIGVGSRIRKGADPFQHLSRNPKDYWIGNMECVCAKTSDQQGVKRKQFIIDPECLSHIRHLDFYGIANNHVMQHGQAAYHEMEDYLDAQHVAFAGANDRRCFRFEHQGKRVGILVFNQRPENFTDAPLYWSLPEYDEISKELASLSDCDFRIVFVHWGNEFINYPYIDQKQFAHFLIDNNANLVVGMHPHVLQGCETYKGASIFYSLGNFVFNMPWEPTHYSIIVSVDLASSPLVSYEYVKIGDDGFPRPVEDVPQAFRMEQLNRLLLIQKENEKYYHRVFSAYNKYKHSNRLQVLKNFLTMNPIDSMGILRDFMNRVFH
ncbi:MAG: CapA family protein [Bacteroidaceae bacterium]|nr:CapA family protein [Bacteroidaceae bacterium]